MVYCARMSYETNVTLASLRAAANAVREGETAVESLRGVRDGWIVAAREDGHEWSAVAAAAGMSVQGVRNAAQQTSG